MLWDIQEKKILTIFQFCETDRMNTRNSKFNNILRRTKI